MLIALLLVMGLFVGGCGVADPEAPGGGAPAQELRLSASRDLKDSPQGRGLIFETLLGAGADGEPRPLLAESWTASDDGLLHTFRLRPGVVFHDGTPFTADTAKFSVEYFAERIGYAQHLAEVSAPDPQTLVIRLAHPYALLLDHLSSELAIKMISPTSVEPPGDLAGDLTNYVGTGPFTLQSYAPDQDATLAANGRYWAGEPDLKVLHWLVIPDPNAQVLALRAGEVDVIGLTEHHSALPYEQMGRLMDDPAFRVGYRSYGRYQTLEFNLHRPAMSDVRVRQALNHGIDRRAMVETLFAGLTEPAERLSPSAPGWEWGPQESIPPWTYDAGRAAALLDEAGWVLPPGRSVREKDGQPLALVLLVPFGETNADVVSLYVQSELQRLGVGLDVVTLEPSAASARRSTGDFDLYMSHSCGTATFGCLGPDGLTSGYGRNTIYKDSPELVTVIDAALTAPTDERRRAGLDEVWSRLHGEALGLPLYDVNKPVAMRAEVSGVGFGPTLFTMDLQHAGVRG
ncbi:ABC transporter substrate-binding protein [Pseudonocardia sp. DLS-67]